MRTEELEAENTNDNAAEGRPFPAENDEGSLLDLLVVLAKHKRTIIRATIVAGILGVIASLLIPSRYTATTTVLPPQQPQSLASSLASQLGGGAGVLTALAGKDVSLKNPNDIYVGMLKSRIVRDALVQRFDLTEVYREKLVSDARKDLDDASEIQSGKDGFISVTVEDRDRKRAADIANAYVEELRKLTSTLAITEAGQRRLFFEEHLRKAKDDLANAEVALKETQQKTGLIQLDGQARAIIESVAAVRAQIASKEVELQAMQSFAAEQNPDLFRLRQELAGLRTQLAKLERQQNSGPGDIQVPTGAVPEAGLQYIRRLRDVKYYETIFELLAKQFEAARLDEARQGAVIQVVDPAVPADKKSFPKRGVVVGLFMICGLLGSLLWALACGTIQRLRFDPLQLQRVAALKELLVFSRK